MLADRTGAGKTQTQLLGGYQLGGRQLRMGILETLPPRFAVRGIQPGGIGLGFGVDGAVLAGLGSLQLLRRGAARGVSWELQVSLPEQLWLKEVRVCDVSDEESALVLLSRPIGVDVLAPGVGLGFEGHGLDGGGVPGPELVVG